MSNKPSPARPSDTPANELLLGRARDATSMREKEGKGCNSVWGQPPVRLTLDSPLYGARPVPLHGVERDAEPPSRWRSKVRPDLRYTRDNLFTIQEGALHASPGIVREVSAKRITGRSPY